MNNILDAADHIIRGYHEIAGERLHPLKLHYLLYCLQRESLAVLGEPAFEGDFEAGDCGPVSPEVMANSKDCKLIASVRPLTRRLREIAANVILDYGALAPWKLRNMLCKEFSWRNARNGLGPEEDRCVMQLSDIRKDARRIREYDLFANAHGCGLGDPDEEDGL